MRPGHQEPHQEQRVAPGNRSVSRGVGLRVQPAIAILLLAAVTLAPDVRAADLVHTPEQAYRLLGRSHTAFEAGAGSLTEADEAFLSALFVLADQVVVLNANVARWFASDGRDGLHFEDYHARIDELRASIRALDAPAKAIPARDLVSGALLLQRAFLHDWYRATQAGRPFESQLTSEYGYHAGLHRSHRMLLQALAELRAIHPALDERRQRAFLDHVRGMDFQ